MPPSSINQNLGALITLTENESSKKVLLSTVYLKWAIGWAIICAEDLRVRK